VQTSPCSTSDAVAVASTILLVDSHEDSRLIYAAALRHHGHVVTAVTCTPDAIDVAAEVRPALVVVELSVTGAPGWRIAAAILERSEPPRLVALSSTGLPEHREHALRLGCVGYLVKPASPLELVAEVARLMAASGDPR
jgi:CheY-like chemotaxis protein